MKADIKYLIPLQGEYNSSIENCPECEHRLYSVVSEIIGFANTNMGLVAICECPKCFTKWYFHVRENEGYERDNVYYYFKEAIGHNQQNHYKNTEPPIIMPEIIIPGRR